MRPLRPWVACTAALLAVASTDCGTTFGDPIVAAPEGGAADGGGSFADADIGPPFTCDLGVLRFARVDGSHPVTFEGSCGPEKWTSSAMPITPAGPVGVWVIHNYDVNAHVVVHGCEADARLQLEATMTSVPGDLSGPSVTIVSEAGTETLQVLSARLLVFRKELGRFTAVRDGITVVGEFCVERGPDQSDTF